MQRIIKLLGQHPAPSEISRLLSAGLVLNFQLPDAPKVGGLHHGVGAAWWRREKTEREWGWQGECPGELNMEFSGTDNTALFSNVDVAPKSWLSL